MPILRVQCSKPDNGAGYSNLTSLSGLGPSFEITRVVVSEDGSTKDATSVDLFIADKEADSGSEWTADPSPHYTIYEQRALPLTATGGFSATTVDLDDNLAPDGGIIGHGNARVNERDPYYYLGFNVLAAGGGGTGTILYVTIHYRNVLGR